MNPAKKFSSEVRAQALKQVDEGRSLAEVAKEFGCSTKTLGTWRKEVGKPPLAKRGGKPKATGKLERASTTQPEALQAPAAAQQERTKIQRVLAATTKADGSPDKLELLQAENAFLIEELAKTRAELARFKGAIRELVG